MENIEREIEEQAGLLEKYNPEDIRQIEKVAKIISDVNTSDRRVFLFGSGSSLNACYYARELFSRDNNISLEVFPAGEAENHADDIKNDDLVILVSQSGESGDILKIKNKILKIKNIVITNNPDSALAEGAEIVIDLKAGEEKAVPATKTYFAELVIFTMLSEALNNRIEILEYRVEIEEEIRKVTSTDSFHRMDTEKIACKKLYILGTGVAWPQAMEAELKLKEIAKVNAEGYELSEFFHGPSELLDENSLVMIICPKMCGEIDNEVLSRIKNKGSRIMAIGACDCTEADLMIKIDNRKYFEPISIVALQKIALELAKKKGVQIDKEINKVVK